jgi:hypothetical protein
MIHELEAGKRQFKQQNYDELAAVELSYIT